MEQLGRIIEQLKNNGTTWIMEQLKDNRTV